MNIEFFTPDNKIDFWIKKYCIIDHNELSNSKEVNLSLSPLKGNCWIFIISDLIKEEGFENNCHHFKTEIFSKKIKKFDFKYSKVFRLICIQFDDCTSIKNELFSDGTDIVENLMKYLNLELTGLEIANKLDSVFMQYKLEITLKQDVVRQIIYHLKENPSLKITELSSKFYLCSRQLHRIFQDEIGCSIKAYQKYLRINECLQQLLLSGYKNLSDVIYSLGYFDHNHFLKDFKMFYGQTPTQLKKINTVCINDIFFVTVPQRDLIIN